MALSYSGGAGAAITVEKGVITDNGDGTYTITPEDGKGKLESNTKIFVDEVLDTEIHTSCSRPLDVGDVHGSFTVESIDEMEEYLVSKLAERGIEPIGVIHDQASISISWLKGEPIDEIKTQDAVNKIVEALEVAEGETID